MNKPNLFKFTAFGILISVLSISAFAQSVQTNVPLLKRTKYQTETLDLRMGSTLSIKGAPVGSIEITGWAKNEIEISSVIEVQAYTQDDLELMANVTGFAVEENLTSINIESLGTHDKKYLKKAHKKFPKNLRTLPFRIDYQIKVPHFISLAVNGGVGDFNLSQVEGMIQVNYLQANAKMSLVGGAVQATIGSGDVDVTIATRSWRGQFAEILVANGNMNLWLPKNFNANLTAKVLRSGKIDNSYEMLKPMKRTRFTDNEMYAQAGNGGAELAFTVGDGSLKIGDFETIAKN